MLIQILGLSILSHTVFGGFVPENRQLVNGGGDSNTGNEWQYCEDKCTEVCHDCEVHHECGEGEIKCGEGPMKKGENGKTSNKMKKRSNNFWKFGKTNHPTPISMELRTLWCQSIPQWSARFVILSETNLCLFCKIFTAAKLTNKNVVFRCQTLALRKINIS